MVRWSMLCLCLTLVPVSADPTKDYEKVATKAWISGDIENARNHWLKLETFGSKEAGEMRKVADLWLNTNEQKRPEEPVVAVSPPAEPVKVKRRRSRRTAVKSTKQKTRSRSERAAKVE